MLCSSSAAQQESRTHTQTRVQVQRQLPKVGELSGTGLVSQHTTWTIKRLNQWHMLRGGKPVCGFGSQSIPPCLHEVVTSKGAGTVPYELVWVWGKMWLWDRMEPFSCREGKWGGSPGVFVNRMLLLPLHLIGHGWRQRLIGLHCFSQIHTIAQLDWGGWEVWGLKRRRLK